MKHITSNAEYLQSKQYASSANLSARIQLHQRFTASTQNWYDWVFERILAAAPAGASIVELGCGAGQLWNHVSKTVPESWRVLLGDFSTGMLVEARENLSGLGEQFAFIALDATKIPIADAQFDAVVANHMLYHVDDRPAAFAEIRRILKPGGVLFAATNSSTNYMQELHALAAKFGVSSGFGVMGNINFNLENGAEQMRSYFSHVKLDINASSLQVTETQALVDYLRSYPNADDWLPGTTEKMNVYIDGQIAKHGAVTITKRSGMFIAHN